MQDFSSMKKLEERICLNTKEKQCQGSVHVCWPVCTVIERESIKSELLVELTTYSWNRIIIGTYEQLCQFTRPVSVLCYLVERASTFSLCFSHWWRSTQDNEKMGETDDTTRVTWRWWMWILICFESLHFTYAVLYVESRGHRHIILKYIHISLPKNFLGTFEWILRCSSPFEARFCPPLSFAAYKEVA